MPRYEIACASPEVCPEGVCEAKRQKDPSAPRLAGVALRQKDPSAPRLAGVALLIFSLSRCGSLEDEQAPLSQETSFHR